MRYGSVATMVAWLDREEIAKMRRRVGFDIEEGTLSLRNRSAIARPSTHSPSNEVFRN